jgi:hypothetical protein
MEERGDLSIGKPGRRTRGGKGSAIRILSSLKPLGRVPDPCGRDTNAVATGPNEWLERSRARGFDEPQTGVDDADESASLIPTRSEALGVKCVPWVYLWFPVILKL